MLSPLPTRSFPRLRDATRSLAVLLGRWALGEPVAVLPQRNADRLLQLELRERMRQAERDNDQALLDTELVHVQLTEAELARLSARNTPLADWPEEDVDALIGRSPDRDTTSA